MVDKEERRREREAHFATDHPRGTTLLSRDKPENRHLWGPSGIGYVDVAETVCTDAGACPHYAHAEDAARRGDRGDALATPIHVLIASFRDRLCPRTLHNAFRRAENPRRVFVRVIEQTQAGTGLADDAGCWERYCRDFAPEGCAEFRDQVRTVHVDAADAKGPTDARSTLSAMVHHDYVNRDDTDKLDFHRVEQQDFCMQIDSHMDFSTNYDTELIFMHHRTENDYAVLSTYVADISQNNQGVRMEVPNLCMVTFTSSIRNHATKECRGLVRPKLTNAMWGAGLSFHRCHAELNVPVDPYLDGVFDGEEGSRGLRFFTHGYDVYTPDVVLVTHDYHTHQGNPVVHTWGQYSGAHGVEKWAFKANIEREKSKIATKGSHRINLMLGIGRGAITSEKMEEEKVRIRRSRFGIGTKRTLEQAEEFSGIELGARRMVENKCGNLVWVPYKESVGYGVEDTLRRSLTGEEVVDASDPSGAKGSAQGDGAGSESLQRVGAAVAASANIRGAVFVPGATQATAGAKNTDARLHSAAEEESSAVFVWRRASTVILVSAVLCCVARLGRRKAKTSRQKH